MTLKQVDASWLENLKNNIPSYLQSLKKEEFINKCKDIENTTDSLYKKMCDEM